MRITFALQNDRILYRLNQRQEDISHLTDAVSSGNRLSSPSDDPTAWAKAMTYRQGMREYDSLLQNVSFATGWNQASDSAINALTDMVSTARQAGISAENATRSDSRNALSDQLDQIIQQALHALNSQYGDQYVFAGSKTDAPPFTFDDATGTLTYNGDTDAVTVRADKGGNSSFTVNTNGRTLTEFTAGNNIIHEFWNLKQKIQAGDTDGINTSLDALENAYTYLANQGSITGNRLAALDNIKTTLTVFNTNAKSDLSDVQDTDVAEALTRIQQSRTAYQAALQVTGMLGNLNLMNYIST